MVEIKVNGEICEISKSMTVFEFLKERNFNTKRVAVEKDGEILPRNLWENSFIKSGESYEIVEFVGGG